jgi:hypothetical protein
MIDSCLHLQCVLAVLMVACVHSSVMNTWREVENWRLDTMEINERWRGPGRHRRNYWCMVCACTRDQQSSRLQRACMHGSFAYPKVDRIIAHPIGHLLLSAEVQWTSSSIYLYSFNNKLCTLVHVPVSFYLSRITCTSLQGSLKEK